MASTILDGVGQGDLAITRVSMRLTKKLATLANLADSRPFTAELRGG